MDEKTPEEIAQDIKALGDSVAVIDEILAIAEPDEEELDRLDRNVRHIEIMLAKDHIKDSGEDLSAFTAAVKRGKK